MPRNIAETLDTVVHEHGDRVGLIEAGSGRELTFSELGARSSCYAAYLRGNGIRAGDRVMLMVKPSADFICLTFALFQIGAPVILVDPGMGYANLLRCIEGVGPRFLIGIPKAILFSKIFRQPFKTVVRSFCCGFSGGLLGADIRRQRNLTKSAVAIHKPEKDDLAAIIFTTGSTGPPKGVRFEHGIFAAQLDLIRDYYGIRPSDIDQPAFPLFALFSTALGACAVIPDMDPTKPAQVDPRKFLSSIERYGVSYSFGSPAIWNVVSRYCLDNGIVLQSLKKVLMAGAPVHGDLLERVKSILPEDAIIYTPYGATESLPIVSIEGSEVLQSTWQKSRECGGTCVGRALPGIEVKVIAITDGPLAEFSSVQELEPGIIGEIIVKGDVVTRAYDNNEQETQLAKIRDGQSFWHRMGDTGYFDDEGRLWFCGRKAHRVITAEKTLYSIPCEAIVNEHPEVFRSALVGIAAKNQPNVKVPVLIIEPKKNAGRSAEEILTEVRKLAGMSELTKDIGYFLIHKDFPVDIRHNAKIFREKLAVWAEGQVQLA